MLNDMKKKTVKDLKPGDNLYFLDTTRYFVSVNKVTNIEEYEYDEGYLKITWEKDEDDWSPFPNFCVVRRDDTDFWEEPDYDSDDYDESEEDEDEERKIFINKEDVISEIKQNIERLQREIEDLPG